MTVVHGGELSLLVHRVRDLVRREPVACGAGTTTTELARRMLRERIGAMIVVGGDGEPIGIVTDRDLRRQLAEGRDPVVTTAEQIMSAPLVTIRPAAFAFEALLEMTRRQIHHLAVVDAGRLAGVVSSHDIMMIQAMHPVTLAREIGRAASLEALGEIAGQVTALVGRLVRDGVAPYEIGQIVAELNDRVVLRVLGLTTEALEANGETVPPVGYCWIVLGSEARLEQTLRTDQDNGLIYADPPPELAESVGRFYRRFGERAIEGLVRVGFPPCPAGSMASNPRWCQPLAAWVSYFRSWMTTAAPASILAASIYFDLRPLAGALELGATLGEIVHDEAPGRRGFLATVARDVVSRPVPLTMFGNVRVRRDRAHRGRVDVKGGGSLQLVGAARLHALQLGLRETNTIERLRAAAALGAIDENEVEAITDAFQHLQRLRLRHQLAQLTQGQSPDNLVAVDALSHTDAVLFRDALHTVRRVQSAIRERFATDFVP